MIGALAVAVLTVGCAKNEYPLSARERQFYMPVDRARITKARNQKMPTIKSETHLAAAKLLEQHGDIKKAIVQYRKAVNSKNVSPEAYHRLGVLLSMLGQNEEATKMLRQAVAVSPDQPVLHNDLGFALTMQAQWKEAEREFRKSIAIEPRFARAYINLGLTLSKMDRFDEAKAVFLAVLPEQDAYYNLGLMYRSMHRYAEASDAFHHVLDVAPDFSAANTQLEDIRDFVPTQSKSALPSPKENLAYQTTKIEKTRLVRIDRPRPADSIEPHGAFERFFEKEDNVTSMPFESQSLAMDGRRNAHVENDSPTTLVATASPEPVLAPEPELTPEPEFNLNSPPQKDIFDLVQANSTELGLFEEPTHDARNDASTVDANSVASIERPAERACFLSDQAFESSLTELSMSPIGEIVEEVSHFCVADDWSAWTHLKAKLMASSYSDEASVSPRASLAVMGYDLREIQSEINCLEDELEARFAENQAREAAGAVMLADITPIDSFDWLLTRSPMVSPESLSELENFMPMPPLDQDYVSLMAEQVDASVDIGRIWTGESEVGSAPYAVLASAVPCEDEETRMTLASSIIESHNIALHNMESQNFESSNIEPRILESFLPESELPEHWSPLPMASEQTSVSFDVGFPAFAHNNTDEPFAWVERFSGLDDSLSVLLNESRCRVDQQWLEEPEPQRLGYCRSDFVQACEPGMTDVVPNFNGANTTEATHSSLPWLGSSAGGRGR